MPTFFVKYESLRYNTSEPSGDDEWERADTAADIDIIGLEFSEHGFDVALPGVWDPTKPLYLLWADYSTGDSFGRDNNQFEAIDVFQDYDKALAAEKVLSVSTDDSYHSVEYIRDDGSVISYGTPWSGYFEYLHSVRVEEVEIIGHDNTAAMQNAYAQYQKQVLTRALEQETQSKSGAHNKRKM